MKVAVYALLIRDGSVALVRRSNTGWMNGHYGLPSGHLEADETLIDAVIREAQEEVTVDLKRDTIRLVHTMHRQSRYIDLIFTAQWAGEPINNEPDKHDDVSWHDMKNLPQNMVPSVRHVIGEYLKSSVFSELPPDYED